MHPRASVIALTYAAFAALWIVLSATLLDLAVDDPVLQGRIELFKGLAFVAVTSGLLYILLRAFKAPHAMPALADPPRPKTRHRVIPIFIALALTVPLFGLAVYVLYAGQTESENFKNLQAVAHLKAGQIENWLAERGGDAASLAASTGFIERIANIRRTGSPRDRALAINRLESIQRSFGYTGVQVFDMSGAALISLGDRHELPTETRALLDAAFAGGGVRHSELLVDAAGRLHLDSVVPLILGDGAARTPVGVVVLHVSPERFLFPTIQTWPTASESGETLLARRDGDSVLYISELRHRGGTALTLRRPLTDAGRPAAIALATGRPGTAKGIDYRGVPVLAAFRPVPGTAWHLIAKVDRSEAMASALSMALWVSAGALLALLLVGAALFMLWRAQRHADRLQNQTDADRLLRQFYTLPFIGMAITSAETKHWVQFNERLCEIFGYTRAELAEKSWADMTHPDDLGKDVAEFERVIKGESEAYAMQKRFIRKDGRIVDTEIDVRCVRKPDRTVDYFVATVQDITARVNDQMQILRLNRMYAALSRCSASVAYAHSEQELFPEICDAVLGSGGMKMAWIGLVDNKGYVRAAASAGNSENYLRDVQITVKAEDPHSQGPTGTCIRENRPFWYQDFMHDPATAPWHAHGERSGWGASAALPLHRSGKPIGALTIYSGEVNAFDEQSRRLLGEIARNVGFALDNFDREAHRREAESALRENEERYRLLFETSLDAILLTGPNGRIYAANPAACRIFGKSEDEIVQGGREGIVDTSDPRLALAVEERNRTGKFFGEITMLRTNGEKFPAEVSTALFKDRSGEVRTSMLVRDISERKAAEAHLLEQLDELRRWSDATLNREERILGLKREVNALLAAQGRPPQYPAAQDEDNPQNRKGH